MENNEIYENKSFQVVEFNEKILEHIPLINECKFIGEARFSFLGIIGLLDNLNIKID